MKIRIIVILVIEAGFCFGVVVGIISQNIFAGFFAGLGIIAALTFFWGVIEMGVSELAKKLGRKSSDKNSR